MTEDTEMTDFEETQAPSPLILALDRPAKPDGNVFIPLDNTVKALRKAMAKSDGVTFVRAPPGTGKTTLINYLAAADNKTDMIKAETGRDESDIRKNIMDAVNGQIQGVNVEGVANAVVEVAKAGKVLVLDEAHTIFARGALSEELFKQSVDVVLPRGKTVRILLVSAAAIEIDQDGKTCFMPSIVSWRFMWYPPVPVGRDLVKDLGLANVRLTPEAVDFFMKVCSGHRQIFMAAMVWVREQQEKEEQGGVVWDIQRSVVAVKESLEHSQDAENGEWSVGLLSALLRSRAVKVSGRYLKLKNIPDVFAMVVFEGPKTREALGDEERDLTVNGFLVPQRKPEDGEFVLYQWEDDSVRYGVPNPLMARYYTSLYEQAKGWTRSLTQRIPTSATDLLLRALPFMSFDTVIASPVPTGKGGYRNFLSASNNHLPFEDDYNDAFHRVFTFLGYQTSKPNSPNDGKVDVVVSFEGNGTKKWCAFEQIMTLVQGQEQHTEHALRFDKGRDPQLPNYCGAHLKALVTIGANKKTVLERLNGTMGKKDLEIIGLVVSKAHDRYELYVRMDASQRKVHGPFLVLCDRVAKSFGVGASARQYRIESVQETGVRAAGAVEEHTP